MLKIFTYLIGILLLSTPYVGNSVTTKNLNQTIETQELEIEPIFGPLISEEWKEPGPTGTLEFKTIGRPEEPIVINGSQILNLIGTSVNNTDVFSLDNDILVYAWDGVTSTWSQIPFQIDERNDFNDSFTFNANNGVLDANDEIVFMTADLGDRPSRNEWVTGCDAPRYEIEVVDPFDGSKKGWAYVFRSFNVETNFIGDYVGFDTAENDITGTNYTMGFEAGRCMLLDQFNITPFGGGDNVDVIDRMNLELYAVAWLPGPTLYMVVEYTENDMYEDFTFEKDSYVRAIASGSFKQFESQAGIVVSSNLTLDWMFYRSSVNVTGLLDIYINDFESLGIDVIIENLNMSVDHESGIYSSWADYRDSYSNLLTIDGIPDFPPAADAHRWWEASSSHGGYVCVWDMSSFMTNTTVMIYEDNASAIDHSGAEPGHYGKSGTAMTDLEDLQVSNFYLQFFPIGSTQFDVGASYESVVDNPLQISTESQQPSIWVDKTASPPLLYGGEMVQYTIYFNNTGTSSIDFVWINDTLPSEVTYIDDSSTSVGGLKTGDYNWTFTNVPVGTHSFVINATVDTNVVPGAPITNWVYCDYSDNFPPCPSSFAWATFRVREPTITIEKVTPQIFAMTGESIQFVLYFNNTGTGIAETVWINDSLPSELTYISDSSIVVGGVKTGDYNWTFSSIAPGFYSFMINTTLSSGSDGTVVLNEAYLNYTSYGGLYDMPGSYASASFIIGKPDITVEKIVTLNNWSPVITAEPGTALYYRVYFNNTGNAAASMVWINDSIPTGVNYVSDTSASAGGTKTGDYNWTFANVQPGNHMFTINTILSSGISNGTVVTNQVFLNYTSYSDTDLPGTSDNADFIALAPDVIVEKTGNRSIANPGDAIQYTIYFNNTAGGTARTIYIDDYLPAEVQYINDTAIQEGGLPLGFCRWRFSNLGFGTHSFVINGQILNTTPIGSTLTNSVFLNYTDNSNTYLQGSNDTFSTFIIGEPDTVEVSAFPTQLRANGTDLSLITTWVNDSAGNGVPNLVVLIEVHSGPGQILGGVIDQGNGMYTALYQAGNQTGTAVIRAFCEDAITQNESTTNILLINDLPVADAGPDQNLASLEVSFDGSGSYDPDGTIINYEWDFGDGENATGPTPPHNYSSEGTYNVTLTVTDNSGANDSDICVIIIEVILLTFNTTVALTDDINGNGRIDSSDNITITVVVTGDFNESCTLEVDVDETIGGGPSPNHTVSMGTLDGKNWTGDYTVLGDAFTTSDVDVKGSDLVNNTDVAEDNATFRIAGDFSYNFVAGWNLISLPILNPINDTTPLLFAHNLTQLGAVLVCMWDAPNQSYICYIAGFNNPSDVENFALEEDMAIWVWFTSANLVTINGYAPNARNVSLAAGWNLVGFMGVSNINNGVETIWAPQVNCGAYDDIAYYSAGTFVHYIFVGTTMDLESGRGYFIWSDVPVNLFY